MLMILLIIKFIIFTDITDVEYNRTPIITISSLFSLFIFSLIFKSNIGNKTLVGLIFYIGVSILLIVDATYYSQFGSLTSVSIIQQVTQISSIGSSIKKLMDPKKIALVIDIVFLLLLYIKGFEIKTSSILYSHPIATGLVLLGILYSCNHNGQLTSIKNQELFIYHIVDIKNTIVGYSPAEAIKIFDKSNLEELENNRNLQKGKFTGIAKGKNLIVLQVEALQNFVIDFEYYGQEVTPNLNRFIKDKSTVYYNSYYQSVGKANTADAEFATNNSLYPSLGGPTYMEYEDNTFYGLPWLLRDNGYTAWAFHGFEKDYWNRDEAYVSQGFQRFISEEDFDFEETIGFGIKDEDFLSQSIDYLKELDNIDDNPFYAFMITLTSHTPFDMPEEYKVIEIKEEHKDTLVGNYINAIHYTDLQIGKFLDALKEEGLYEDSVIVIYGDHYAIPVAKDEDRNIMTDLLNKPYDHDQMMNVPLMIHLSGQEVNQTIDKLSSQIDFYPTIANIMGYKLEKGLIFGKDINNNNEKTHVFPQIYMKPGSVITDDAIFEMSKDGVFEHSKARQRSTGESLDIGEFRQLNIQALKEIHLSNFILKNDLLKQKGENK